MSSAAAQQYLLLAKSARGSAAADLVLRVIEHPDIYGFAEFLRLESLINSLKQDHSLLISTLELFAYGTLSDYESQRSQFISLSPIGRRKLQLLTLASLASHARILSYNILLEKLQIESVRELEDLIIDGIYAQVIQGKLDQLNSRLNVEYALARDVNINAFNNMENVLDKWCLNCSNILNVLKYEATNANNKKKQTLNEQDKYEKEMLSVLKVIDLQGQNAKRDNLENDDNIHSLHNLSNMLTGNIDSKQGGIKKSIRQGAKRIFRP